MPALKNQRHEKFALALFEGKSATEAYSAAGYKPCRQNAARLTTKDDIRVRLAELQAPVAAKAAINVDSLNAEIDAALAVAADRGQAAAMVAATSLRAKIAGLLVQRVEIGAAGAFDDAESVEEIIEAACKQYSEQGYTFDDDDKARLGEMFQRCAAEEREFLASCKAKPVTSIDSRAQEAIERRRMGLTRPGSQHRLISGSNGRGGSV
jgi:phage terminase small subunit